MTRARLTAISLLIFFVGIPWAARAVPANPWAGPPWPAEVSIPSSHRLKFVSRINGESYTIFIRVPLVPPPPNGYPVIYVLDGDQYFGAASDISGPAGPVIVAIGYGVLDDMAVAAQYSGRKADAKSPLGVDDVFGALNTLRFHDLTLPVAPEHRAPEWQMPKNIGGVDDFLKVIETEIKPRVAALVPVDPANTALFGHSIGGLAVLRALFTEPTAFRTYIAASPSIWWDADAVLAGEKDFDAAVEGGRAAPRVLITVGADEEKPKSDKLEPEAQAFADSLPPDRRSQFLAYLKMADSWGGMVSNARALADRLGRLHGTASFKVEFIAFAGERHDTVAPAALSRGVRFALEK